MKNNDNKKKLLILVGILLLIGGISYAYFTGVSTFNGNGSSVEGVTSNINGAQVNVSGTLELNDLDILPGHKNVSSIKLTATGNNEFISYNLIWNGINSLNTPLNYTVYKTNEKIEVTANCDKKQEAMGSDTIYYEECTIANINNLGDIISKGTINKSTEERKEILVSNEFITATSEGTEVYYYVVLEYPNLDEDQNIDMGGSFQGVVTVEASTSKADINIVKVYANNEEVGNIPKKEEGLILDTEKSSCTNNAKPIWDNNDWSLKVQSLSTSGTDCNLYFTKSASSEILSNVTINEGTPDFSQVATTDEGVYKAEDDDGDTYYFRGAVTNNYVKFANKFWRIIRINGDGTIRLIYQGTSATSTGTNAQIGTSAFVSGYSNNNMYVGFKYTSGQVHGTGTKSTILGVLETWYNNNLADYASKLDTNAGFCGDRTPSTSETEINNQGGTGTTQTYYGGYIRLDTNKSPILNCSKEDLYTMLTSYKGNKSLEYPIGLITADEVSMAGGVESSKNNAYYLYTGQAYRTITPSWFNKGNTSAFVFSVWTDGSIGSYSVDSSYGVRPVINLRQDVKLTGTGTMNDPYVVQ